MADTPTSAPSGERSGCLGEAEVLRVRGAPPGQVPGDLARHLAACERCQERVLFGALPRGGRRREMPKAPSPARTLVLLALMAAAILAFFITLRGLLAQF